MNTKITYTSDLTGVNWQDLKTILLEDDFDNGRTPQQLQDSFTNSYASSIAYAGSRIIGTARVLSDGVCNAYLVDVWTYTPYRRQGIARRMIQDLLHQLPGQHVYLATYRTAGIPAGLIPAICNILSRVVTAIMRRECARQLRRCCRRDLC